MFDGDEGLSTFEIRNIGEGSVGKAKLVQMFCRYFYGEDCGKVLHAYRTISISNETKSILSGIITSAVSKTVEKILSLQEGETLHPDETLVRASIINLDIMPRTTQVNIKIELITLSGSQQMVL